LQWTKRHQTNQDMCFIQLVSRIKSFEEVKNRNVSFIQAHCRSAVGDNRDRKFSIRKPVSPSGWSCGLCVLV